MFPQTTLKYLDSTHIEENRKDEPENAHFTRSLGPRTSNEVAKEGQTFEVIQEIPKALHDENSDSTEPENAQGDLLSSKTTTELTVAVNIVNHRTGIYKIYKFKFQVLFYFHYNM